MYGIINLIHSDPLFYALNNKIEIKRDTAFNILGMIEKDELDAGMVSLVQFLNSDLKLIETANIHTLSNTMSTLLISRNKHIENNIEIAVTSLTATTSFYLSLILNKMGIKYELIKSKYTDAQNLLNNNDYALVIGDDALLAYKSNYNIIFDIGYEFSRLFNLMPVYAVTASKRDFDHKIIDNAIAESKNYVEKSIIKNQTKVKKEILKFYYNTIKYDYNFEVNETVNFLKNIILKNEYINQ
ncbi:MULTISPECIES: MqnA/MqnD/SBP family protein [Acidiplasma]|jgi:predicted solute-binding protein|uniref:MqnA/MqnD/SBP family protein n=1 Tax=Acidiplasma TaxID=507753 RepID=UPI0005E3BABE|nr:MULTISPECIES: MqnA/MqnD/SBP family protein [unclassified Acidiplasma]KJE48973.1 hypothetical protein TZ01_06820 [Acidiplasma sp. MBA-1]WMT54395.1 MAG: MqnA/MqnD/SBP family protein [Acidiplasma sp.]